MRLIYCVLPWLASTALAQTPATPNRMFDLERLELNPGAQGSLVVSSGDTLPEGGFRFSLTGDYQHNPAVVVSNGVRVGAAVANRATAHITAAYALERWLEVGLSVPVVMFQKGDQLTDYGIAPIATTALGASWVQGRLALLRERDGSPIDGAVQLSVKVPGTSSSAFTRDAWVGFSPRLSIGSTLGPVRMGGEIAYTLRSLAQLGPDLTDVSDEVGSELDFSFSLHTARKGLNGEVSARLVVPLSRAPIGGELLIGARYPLGDWFEVFAVTGPGLGRLPGIPDFRVIGGLAVHYVPPPTPKAPTCTNLKDHVPSDCPDLDLDADGVMNRDDLCPAQSGPISNQGCPVRDSDGDSVPDDVDACPGEPGPRELRGCPLKDADQDGVPDAQDGCPLDRGPVENKGCPSPL